MLWHNSGFPALIRRKNNFVYRVLYLVPGALVFCSCSKNNPVDFIANENEIEDHLHIPSPAWDDQIIYFIVTDRFMDGDTSNNDQGVGEYKKGIGKFWNGGDLKGITQRLDYIKELGATGIWITPPVANQWVNPQKTGTGNHGYWASDFSKVDKHLGTLDDYRQLSASLHKNGMYLIQDVVCNHMGDFYTYTDSYNPAELTKNFKIHNVPQPTQYPFNHNDVRKTEDEEMAVYHFAPNFNDHSDTIKKRNYQFADLDDLNTENPFVRQVLRETYNFWIKEVGVDGFRFDTPHFIDHDFWHDFIHSDDEETPGVEKFAKKLGKHSFLTFGETALPSKPLNSEVTYEVARYLGTKNKPEMTSILNFPLANSIQNVFAGKKPTSYLTYRLENIARIFEQPEFLLNFIDNHDGARFLTQTGQAEFRQALLFIMTIPGIPVIYYGTEQELLGTRQTMFKGGVGSPDRGHFNTDNESFRFMQNLIQIRKQHDVFRRGDLKVLRDASGGPGTFIYQLSYDNEYALVIYNTSDSPRIVDELPTAFKAGSSIKSYFNISGEKKKYTIDQKGNLSLLVPAHTGIILMPGSELKTVPNATGEITIDPLADSVLVSDRLTISGSSNGVNDIRIAIDGHHEKAVSVVPLEDGSWIAELELNHLLNGEHRVVAYSEDFLDSDYKEFDLDLPAILCAEYRDEIGDDWGPSKNYQYPTSPGYNKQMDILGVKAYRIGMNLKVDINMGEISEIWLPPNGFDHVLINMYIDLPDSEGVDFLPLQNALMPDDAHWDFRMATAGFSNRMFSREQASSTNPGKSVGPTSFVTVTDRNTISFLISSESLAYPTKLKGAKLYINTWGGNPSNLSDLNPDPQPWSFGGGTEKDPRIMDDTHLIELN